MKFILIGILALFLLGCGEDDMAHIGEEVGSTLVDTNVTDSTQVYDTTEITVTAHNSESSFIIKNGTLWSTGANNFGQLGLGDNIDTNSFTDTGIANVKSVFCGDRHTFIIKTDGTLWATGYNYFGQLGLGTDTDINIFTNVGITDVKTVSAGVFYTFIIKTDGTLWATGDNQYGQLGLNDTTNRSSFTDTGVTDVKSVCGYRHALIVKQNSSLWSTGYNNFGQLGLGDTTNRNSFTDTGITDVKTVSAGGSHSLIIKTDDTLWATGWNAYGQLGLGDNLSVSIFTDTGVTDVKSVSAGWSHTAIVKTLNTLWSTGQNNFGQLGLGDNVDTNSFTDTGVADVDDVKVGSYHSLIIKTNNTLWATGKNGSGQLGLGDNIDTNSFTDVGEIVDTQVVENWTAHYAQDVVRIGGSRYLVSLLTTDTPSIYMTLSKIGTTNDYKPFDGQNITPAISSSPMTYTITGTEEFNAFTLAKVLATSVTYTFKNSLGATIKTDTVSIDVSRDENGTLSDYPTTVIYYADQQMEIGSTVEITLTYTDDIELGDFTLNNTIDSGFTNLAFSHGIKDFNNYTPDAWGNIPEAVKAIVTTFSVTMDFPLTNYDYTVSFNESISGKNVTIDASDSNGAVADGATIFGSLTRRVRVTNVSANSVVKDNGLDQMASLKLSVQEIV